MSRVKDQQNRVEDLISEFNDASMQSIDILVREMSKRADEIAKAVDRIGDEMYATPTEAVSHLGAMEGVLDEIDLDAHKHIPKAIEKLIYIGGWSQVLDGIIRGLAGKNATGDDPPSDEEAAECISKLRHLVAVVLNELDHLKSDCPGEVATMANAFEAGVLAASADNATKDSIRAASDAFFDAWTAPPRSR